MTVVQNEATLSEKTPAWDRLIPKTAGSQSVKQAKKAENGLKIIFREQYYGDGQFFKKVN